jgi:uncharacterized protein (DUF2235 family)
MGKKIVICCDGTGNEYGNRNTNVVKLFQALKIDSQKQIAYYDPGVGTLSAPMAFSLVAKAITKLYGLAFGYGITKNIEDAYEYLMDKYEEDSEIYLFGFSRGAFTVRALAGMIYKCGLLHKGSNNLIPYATRMYRYGEKELADGFKKTFSRDVRIHFIGVWDTVKSVGLFIPRKFPDSKLNPDVEIGRHAVSIDEKRSKFRPNLWDEADIPPESTQDIKQVWFAGVHSDVGGSYAEDGLSNITLKWMLDEAADKGLLVNDAIVNNIKGDHKGKIHNSLLPIWWILLWWKRKIEPGSNIHQSVYDRLRDVREYRPKNLPGR